VAALLVLGKARWRREGAEARIPAGTTPHELLMPIELLGWHLDGLCADIVDPWRAEREAQAIQSVLGHTRPGRRKTGL
jgi:hypothetical protein